MDKNTFTGLLLMAALMFGFMYCNRPDVNEQAAQEQSQKASADKADNVKDVTGLDGSLKASLADKVRAYGAMTDSATRAYELTTDGLTLRTDSTGNVTGSVVADNAQVSVAAALNADDASVSPEQRAAAVAMLRSKISSLDKYRDFASFLGGANDTITIDNGKMRVTFSSRGGRVDKVVLPGYKTETTTPATDVCLFNANNAAYEFEFETATQRISTGDLNFNATKVNDTTVVMSLPLANGAELALRYTVIPDEYLVRMSIEQKNMMNVIPANRSTMRLKWHESMQRNELGHTFEERNSAIYYKFNNESPEDLSSTSDADEQLTGNIRWIAFKNQFFSSVIIADSKFNTADLDSKVVKSETTLKDMSMDATFDYSSSVDSPASFTFFFGPNDYPLLSGLDKKLEKYSADGADKDLDLTKLVPLGWGILGWINRFVVIPVFDVLSKHISNYGIIILILTILLKIVTFPLTFKSYKSQAKMRVLAPEVKEINDKYPGQENAMKRQQETMKLYSRAGASPFSGCIPMLLQWPILIAMFAFFPNAIELRGQSFLWVHDLSAPDYICTLPFSIPLLGNHLSLFCLLMTAVNIIYTQINMQNQPSSSSMPGMKAMMWLMPLMFLFFFNDYAAGLSYYYFVSLLITIVQTFAFRMYFTEDKVRAEMAENAKKPKKKSGFMARLEAAQKQQEAYMREQAKQQAKRRR
jgi:YidC/Oxa1 family membrane protein insertase